MKAILSNLNSYTALSLFCKIHLFIFNPLYGEIEQIFPVHQHVLAIYYHYYRMDGCLGHFLSNAVLS